MSNAEVALQTRIATAACPWCGSVISRSKFAEIENRIAEQERRKLAEERARMDQQLRTEVQKAEARVKIESDKKLDAMVAERDKAPGKITALELRQEAIRH